jgi:hypothetical protein
VALDDDFLHLRVVGEQGVHVERAEPGGEVTLLGGRDALAAEHEQLVLDQGLLDRGDGVLALRARQIDMLDLGGEGRVERCDHQIWQGDGAMAQDDGAHSTLPVRKRLRLVVGSGPLKVGAGPAAATKEFSRRSKA